MHRFAVNGARTSVFRLALGDLRGVPMPTLIPSAGIAAVGLAGDAWAGAPLSVRLGHPGLVALIPSEFALRGRDLPASAWLATGQRAGPARRLPVPGVIARFGELADDDGDVGRGPRRGGVYGLPARRGADRAPPISTTAALATGAAVAGLVCHRCGDAVDRAHDLVVAGLVAAQLGFTAAATVGAVAAVAAMVGAVAA